MYTHSLQSLLVHPTICVVEEESLLNRLDFYISLKKLDLTALQRQLPLLTARIDIEEPLLRPRHAELNVWPVRAKVTVPNRFNIFTDNTHKSAIACLLFLSVTLPDFDMERTQASSDSMTP